MAQTSSSEPIKNSSGCICDPPGSNWGYTNGVLTKCPFHVALAQEERCQRLSFSPQGKIFNRPKPFDAIYQEVKRLTGKDNSGFRNLCLAMGEFANGLAYGWHLLLGPPGTYKSTLLANIHQCMDLSVYADVRNLAAGLFRAARRDDSEGDYLEIDEIVHRYGTCPVLLLDELGAEYINGSSDFVISHLTGMMNERYSRFLPTVIASNLDEAAIERRYGSRLASRLFDRNLAKVWVIDLPDMRRLK